MADYTVKRNDHGYTIDLRLEQYNATTQAWEAIPGLDTATALKLILKSGHTIVTGLGTYAGSAGVISYTWTLTDLNSALDYQAEVEIHWLDGSVETVPNDSYFTVSVLEDLA